MKKMQNYREKEVARRRRARVIEKPDAHRDEKQTHSKLDFVQSSLFELRYKSDCTKSSLDA
jgi:hypothetical protein